MLPPLRISYALSTARPTLLHLCHPRYASSDSTAPVTPSPDSKSKSSSSPSFFSKDRIAATSDFPRWWLVPPAVATHMCLGSFYGWSLLNKSLVRDLGVVGTASADWALSDVVPVFAAIGAVHGLSAAVLGRWQESAGPRLSGVFGALCFGGGFAVGGMGVMIHSLPLLYLGCGLVAGTGIGFGYVPPVATLLRWFPDRRGMATGLTIMGFGGGALVIGPYMLWLMKQFQKPPTYLGSADTVHVITENGKRLVEVEGQMREAVIATAADLAQVNMPGLQEGVYLAGTGSTGVGMTLMALGATYFVTMLASALAFRLPPADHPETIAARNKAKNPMAAHATAASTPEPVKKPNPMISSNHVHLDNVMKLPQFWLVWFGLGSIACTGMGVLSVASNMMSEIFSRSMPEVVTGAFCATFVMALSAANLGGRLVWASASDYIGRKRMYALYTAGSVPLYFALPYFAHDVAINHNMSSLLGFYGSTLLILSFFGGAYSTTPAYEADLFGTKFVGAVHGRMLTASAAGAAVGPTLITILRGKAEKSAIYDLASKVDPTKFEEVYKVPLSELDELVAAKGINASSLLQLCPPGTLDPLPHLYDTAMYASACLVAVAAVGNYLIRPVNAKYHMPPDPPSAKPVQHDSGH